MIINRGRGPEIQGTRITVYRIMDFEGESTQDVAKELKISEEMVKIAREYIENNKEQVTLEYNQIINGVRETSNPPWLEEKITKRMTELRQRIKEQGEIIDEVT